MYKDTGWFLARLFIFLLLNFGALFIGGYFTEAGVKSEWYAGLSKAPWTPPGFVFGVAWFTVMLTFSFFMAGMYKWFTGLYRAVFIAAFVIQWILNTAWNPLFFYYHKVTIALFDIVLLFLVVIWFLIQSVKQKRYYPLLVLPYFLWLMVAISLNLFIALEN